MKQTVSDVNNLNGLLLKAELLSYNNIILLKHCDYYGKQ
jgi:hypothetical protein